VVRVCELIFSDAAGDRLAAQGVIGRRISTSIGTLWPRLWMLSIARGVETRREPWSTPACVIPPPPSRRVIRRTTDVSGRRSPFRIHVAFDRGLALGPQTLTR